MTKLNFIQDEATPHNNVLISALVQRKDVQVNLWYARDKSAQYTWDKDLSNEVKQANIYGDKKINWSFISYILKNRNEKYFIVGWSNPTTRLIVVLFWLLRRPYSMWFDHPQDRRSRGRLKHLVRNLYYLLIHKSDCKIFCVGKKTVEYFGDRGFKSNRLVNLPIYVDVSKDKSAYNSRKDEIFSKYGIRKEDLFLVTGSRLVKEKGFDILIDALSFLPVEKIDSVKLLIVGKGEEKNNLLKQIEAKGLLNTVIMEDWLDIESFMACIANSDFFVHPARWDAYGASIFAMSLGVSVIGSDGAGSVVDRITNEVNGYIYKANDKTQLTKILLSVLNDRSLSKSLGDKLRVDSLSYTPELGALKLMENCI